MGNKTDTKRILVGKPNERDFLAQRRWEENISNSNKYQRNR
jgi:hypothetical protein